MMLSGQPCLNHGRYSQTVGSFCRRSKQIGLWSQTFCDASVRTVIELNFSLPQAIHFSLIGMR